MVKRLSIQMVLTLFLLLGPFHCKEKTSSLAYDTNSTALAEKSKEERLQFLDSVLGQIDQNKIDSLGLALFFMKGNVHYDLGQHDSVDYYDRKLAVLAKRVNNPYYLARAYRNMGYSFRNRFVYDSAYFYFLKSKDLFLAIKDTLQAAKRLRGMADIQNNQNDFFGSKETITEAIELLKDRNEEAEISNCYNSLGTSYRKLLSYENAIANYENAIATSNNADHKATFKNNLAQVYNDMGQPEKAIAVFNALTSTTKLDTTSVKYARLLHNKTYSQWKNGTLDQPKAFFEALKIRTDRDDKRGLISSYTDLGEYFLEKDPVRAKNYLNKVIRFSRQLKIPKAETDALQLLMELEPGHITRKDRYIFLKDSLYKQELKVKTQFAHMRYLDEQEKLKILTLERETAEKRVEIAEQRTQKTIVLSLLGLFIIGSTSLIFYNRQKFKKEKLQEVYNTEKRISQDLHEGLANTVFGLITNVQQNSTNKVELLNQLETIYESTRDISHDNAILETGEHFGTELLSLIDRYQSETLSIVSLGIKEFNWSDLSHEKSIVTHRAVKELLVNLKKHAKATLASLKFSRQKNRLLIRYKDNGIGFTATQKKGLGLKHINERVHDVNGNFTVHYEAKKGAEIEISIPIR